MWRSHPKLVSFYLDDGVIIGSYSALQAVLGVLGSDEAKKRGLYLSLSKSKLWWPTPPDQDVIDAYPAELQKDFF